MNYLLDAQKTKFVDSYTIEQTGIPSVVLMEKAAMAVADVVMENTEKSDRILVLCGSGNNGGDGIATARILKGKGYHADIFFLGEEEHATEQTKLQLKISRNLGVRIMREAEMNDYPIIVDAIFGIGLSRAVEGKYEDIIRSLNETDKKVFAVDIPSGIHADSGKILNIAVKADYTVTFGYNKIGLVLYPGCEYAGEVIVADIGFSPGALQEAKPDVFVYEKSDVKNLLPKRKNYSNKGSYGKVLVIAGSKNMSGACYLSAKAAYRTGAGLVKILTVEENRTIMQSELPEAIVTTYIPENFNDKLEINRLTEEVKWASSIVIGPGIGISQGSKQLLELVIQSAKVPVIIDADAINIIANYQTEYERKEYFEKDNVIFTPHIKEMAGLSGCRIDEITDDIIKFAVDFTRDKKVVLALKDARSLVTNGSKVYVNTSGNHGMATGGSGDALTGIIAALSAQGLKCFESAALGVYIHGLAGDYVMNEKNCYSLIAGDIIEALSYVLK